LKILSEGVLKNLIFKGGTCMKKLFFGGSGRFSMDLDFTSAGVSVEELKKSLANVLKPSTKLSNCKI
jgi:predicted nucleotidyltransferase component of viral defense system